jgi:hypothetical protein
MGITMKKYILPLVMSLVLAACGPSYHTEYEIVPPQTETGRFCANNCLLAQQSCRQGCQMQGTHCQEMDACAPGMPI